MKKKVKQSSIRPPEHYGQMAADFYVELMQKDKSEIARQLAMDLTSRAVAEDIAAELTPPLKQKEDQIEALKDQLRIVLERRISEQQVTIASAPKKLASRGGVVRSDKYAALRTFAEAEFDKRTWRSVKQGAEAIFPAVLNEAKRIGAAITTTRGPTTVYGWLLVHKKK